jgi:hypothetical protein
VHAKVLAMQRFVREGFALAEVQDAPQGGVRVALVRGRERRILAFAPFEVPAIVQECSTLGLAK